MRAREFILESKIVEYNGIQLDVSIDGANVDIRALKNNNQVGYAVFDRDGTTLTPIDLSVDKMYRGSGIAKSMYDYAKNLGFKIKASTDQTLLGKEFWQKHRGDERVWEAVLDPGGWGETPYGTDIDYFGLRVQMKPSAFLKLALPLGSAETNPEVEKHMRAGGKIAYPMLDIEIPDGWEKNDFSEPAKVVSHEGRNRMKTWIDLKGDDPIQVNIRPRGWYRRSHLTPEHLEAISKGLISQRGNFVSGPLFPVDSALEEDTVDEAEKRTPASMEIRSNMRNAGYKLLGSGADATVWAKKEGPVIKIIMPDDGQGAGAAGDTFMRFYEFCKEHEGYDNLPKFSANEVEAFEADGKQYIMVTMERLRPIPRNSFQEAMVWILSDLATKAISWEKASQIISDEKTWMHYDEGMNPVEILQTFDSLDQRDLLEYEVLFKLMTLLYHRGRINKIGWDLHTENAMMRGDTIVITDPWFNMETK